MLRKEYTWCDTIFKWKCLFFCERQEHPLKLIRVSKRNLWIREHFCFMKLPEFESIFQIGRWASHISHGKCVGRKVLPFLLRLLKHWLWTHCLFMYLRHFLARDLPHSCIFCGILLSLMWGLNWRKKLYLLGNLFQGQTCLCWSFFTFL